jgi:hypothetical protein
MLFPVTTSSSCIRLPLPSACSSRSQSGQLIHSSQLGPDVAVTSPWEWNPVDRCGPMWTTELHSSGYLEAHFDPLRADDVNDIQWCRFNVSYTASVILWVCVKKHEQLWAIRKRKKGCLLTAKCVCNSSAVCILNSSDIFRSHAKTWRFFRRSSSRTFSSTAQLAEAAEQAGNVSRISRSIEWFT